MFKHVLSSLLLCSSLCVFCSQEQEMPPIQPAPNVKEWGEEQFVVVEYAVQRAGASHYVHELQEEQEFNKVLREKGLTKVRRRKSVTSQQKLSTKPNQNKKNAR